MELSASQLAHLRKALIERVAQLDVSSRRNSQIVDLVSAIPNETLADEAEVLRAALGERHNLSAPTSWFEWLLDPELGSVGTRVAFAEAIAKRVVTDGELHALRKRLRMGSGTDYDAAIEQLASYQDSPSLAGVHSMLATSLRVAPQTWWPKGPLHRGGLRPKVPSLAFAELARHLSTLVDEPHAERLRQSALKEQGIPRGDMGGASIRPLARGVTKSFVESSDRARCTRFLAAIDTEILRLDVKGALAKRKKNPTSQIVAAVWRGAERDVVTMHMAELASGLFGLLVKFRGRFRWIEGPSDDVLASVPDSHFEEAAMAAAKYQRVLPGR